MKPFLLTMLIVAVLICNGQQNPRVTEDYKNIPVAVIHKTFKDINNNSNTCVDLHQHGTAPEESIIGLSWYDLQSNTLLANRFHLYDDGTMGAVWTRGVESPPSFPDRGTGYNFYDGTAWGPQPEERLETDRTGWPSYAPLGE